MTHHDRNTGTMDPTKQPYAGPRPSGMMHDIFAPGAPRRHRDVTSLVAADALAR